MLRIQNETLQEKLVIIKSELLGILLVLKSHMTINEEHKRFLEQPLFFRKL